MLLVQGKIYVPNTLQECGIDPADRTGNLHYAWLFMTYTGLDDGQELRPRYKKWVECVKWTRDPENPFTGALLQRVSKNVQEEAELIFWGWKNEFIFPAGRFERPSFFHGWGGGDVDFVTPPVQNISFAFDQRDYDGFTLYSDPSWRRMEALEDDPDLTGTDLRDRIHFNRESSLAAVWADRCAYITANTRLKRLQIDFEECYCPVGCCRKVDYVCNMLHTWELAPPEHWEIIGFLDAKEQEIILEKLTCTGVDKSTITFKEWPNC